MNRAKGIQTTLLFITTGRIHALRSQYAKKLKHHTGAHRANQALWKSDGQPRSPALPRQDLLQEIE
ncbi:MAG: hypothetical protein CME59_16320 [Halioglobus sp.]|nr:hypothetical protein [Halioglobus sp.]